ncbi:Trimethylamine--corrinoid methyltransferase [Candidatus Desulfarcum epimagneticum]|uniref:Trimethylamine--corrinoid methyltransferase n=1 Tax=uncultured Desulfobacteraceae bacterium TaxID=218296 RepID=A0A484HMC2_9BACT|nr:Trimethylamine--corrinoid methyltransferase [uncultured Desulfobacteraceae bacterium]
MDIVEQNFLTRIHEDAKRTLEEVGVRLDSPEIRAIFEDTGLAAYDETLGHLHILPELIDQVLAVTPKREDFFIPENAFGVGGTAPFVYDSQTGELIQPTLDHVIRIAKIVNEADVTQFMARGVLIPNQEVTVMDAITAHCKKPIYVAALTPEGIDHAHEIHCKRGGITVQFSILNSPLNLIESMADPFIECVRKKTPVYVSSMPMAGLSGPYSMSGLLTLTHAEALFGIALTQLISPGNWVVHAGLPSIANIQKNYAVDLGLVSHNIANLLLEKVNKGLNIPSIQTACATSQDKPNKKSEQEAIAGYALMKKYGFHQMRHAFGFLKELVSFSIEKLEKHIDLCEITGAESAPEIEKISYDEKGYEAIVRNGAQANYMRDQHTLENIDKAFVF